MWSLGPSSLFFMWLSCCSSSSCWKDIWVYFWTLNSIPLICMSVLVPTPHCLYYYCFVASVEMSKCEYFALFFCFITVLAIAGPLKIHMSFRISLSISTRKPAEILTRIALTRDKLRQYCHFNNIKSSDAWTWDFFHLFRSLKNFQQCFVVFRTLVLHCSCWIHSYFTLFNGVINGIFS